MRFLVVDDGYDWVKFHSQNIKNAMPHAQIDIAMSGFDALNMAFKQDENYYDIILSDMQMEDVEDESYAGIWLIKRLLASGKCKNTKIIIISAVYNIKEVAKNLNVNYISKSLLISHPIAFEHKLKELLKL
ncbi:MAG: response regulator [bacterium]